MTQHAEQIIVALKPQYTFAITDEDGEFVLDEHGNRTFRHDDPLGFATLYDPEGKRGVDQNAKAFTWAYGPDYVERNGIVHVTERTWKNNQRIEWEEPAKIQPMIIRNVPLNNFRIASTVSRSSTNNKLWRILDPRGFELEISTANMEEILTTGTVSKGVILDQCKWDFGKSGKGKVKLVIVE